MTSRDAPANEARPGGWRLERHAAIDDVADAWDRFVPRDAPHLRAGMLRAVERGGVVQEPTYLLLRRGDALAATAVAFSLPLDTAASVPALFRSVVERVRKRAPGFLWKTLRICGSPISNADSGVCFAPELAAEARRAAFGEIAREIIRRARLDQTLFFKDFHEQAVAAYASQLEALGCFAVDPWAGTRLDVAWEGFDGYLAALKKRYRRRVRGDLKEGEAMDFVLLDDFAALAPRAAALYRNVLSRAKSNLETATEGFFAAVSQFDQAALLVARDRAAGEVLGVNLLLFGDTCMHNMFIGFDYEQNERAPIYFNLVERSLKAAIERGCRTCYFGPDSYEFKARLGARPFRLTAYMKHRLWPVHMLLRAQRKQHFPPNEPVTHDVFQDGGGEE